MVHLRVRNRISLIIILILMNLLFSGCWDRRELEDQAFVTSIGIDKGKQKQLLVTFSIAIPSKIGFGQTGGGGPGGAKQGSLVTTVAAPNLTTATVLATGYVNRQINLMHTKAILFGEDFARQGVGPVLGTLTRYRELRRDIFMGVTAGNAYEVIKANEPDLEKSIAKWWEDVKLMQEAEGMHSGPLLQEFVTKVQSTGFEPSMIYLAVNKNAKKPDPKEIQIPAGFKEGELTVKAGDIPRIFGNPVESMGTALFRGDKFLEALTLIETRSLLLLTGNFRNAIYLLEDPLNKNNFLTIELKQGSPPAISVSIKDGRPLITERLSLEGDLLSVQGNPRYLTDSKIQDQTNKLIAAEIQKRCYKLLQKLQKNNSDLIGYGPYAKRLFLTQQEWENFNWKEKFPEADIKLEVKFNIRRTGMQGKSPEIYIH